jgi:5-formyltetrahydrofolate cyclo-ligase
MKSTLRQRLRIERRAIAPAEHARRSAMAAAAVKRMSSFKSGARVAIYLACHRETDTAALVLAARRRGVRLYVPVVSDLRHRRLRFHPLAGPLRSGAFGIAVPRRRGRPVECRWFDMIVLPLVGVDAHGRRLGMGGGFYDRALRFRRARRCWNGPRLVGFAFDCQRVASVHADPWDVQLDFLATESGIHRFAKGTQ